MRQSHLSCMLAVAALALAAAPAEAHLRTVGPGDTLWSIAAANNFTTRALAAANGLPEDAHVVLGTTIRIPSEADAAAALGGGAAQGAPARAATAPVATGAGPAPAPQGAYVVRWADTLSGIAARAGVPMAQLAHMNGIDPSGPLLAGTALKLPTGAPAAVPAPGTGAAGSGSAAAAATSSAGSATAGATVVPKAAPYPAPGRVTAAEVGQVAQAHGVPPSLAAAIGWQESGFNNAMVSSANARGVMQVLPGTWDWIEGNLASRPLDPASPHDNVHAGVLYLGQLLRDTGGDPALAAAAYYQGLSSVRRIGMLPETRRYVANVMALRGRFGG